MQDAVVGYESDPHGRSVLVRLSRQGVEEVAQLLAEKVDEARLYRVVRNVDGKDESGRIRKLVVLQF